MFKNVIEKAMRIGRAALFLPGVIYRRMRNGHPETAPSAARSMLIEGDSRRNTRRPDLRTLILLFVLCVLASLAVTASASAATLFTNPTLINIPGSSTSGPASPYPSEIAVSGLTGPITNVAVTLHRFGHTSPAEVDILLVSPSGTGVILMSDACSDSDSIEDFTWTFSQAAPRQMSQDSSDCAEFTYRPTNHPDFFGNTGDTWAPPAPPGPYSTNLDAFDNENPNGAWKLYVMDDTGLETGDIEGGWSLSIQTGPVDVTIPGSGTSGPASPYPAPRTVSGQTGIISDLNVTIDGIWHERPDDLDLLLVGPEGQKVILMSDACGTFEVAAYGWGWDDEAAAPMPDSDAIACGGSRFHRPADHEPGDSWPAPAPAGPYATSLSAFDGTDPNGEWLLFVQDDADGGTGFFTNRFQLGITTMPRPDTTAPDTTITSGPSGLTRSTSAAFGFSSSEAGSSFECKLDSGAFAACISPKSYTNLKNGRHVFRVRAIDAAGNVDPTPAVRAWTVDTVKPSISGLEPRANSTIKDRTPTIKATVKDNLTDLSKNHIKLFLDGKPVPRTKFSYNRSTDGLTYTSKKLTFGKHAVKIVARDAAGNVAVKSWSFKVIQRR
jgi:subtilisin-like proprotein convertase family protein